MIFLEEIKDYVQKTAMIIASVLEMQVIICDEKKHLLGDSNESWVAEKSCISDNSILKKVMKSKQNIILENLNDHEGCANCPNKSKCDVLAIVGVPIKYNDTVIGSFGILADSKIAKEKLLSKQNYYLSFIEKMSDLLLSKLNEKDKNNQLMILRQRLISIINSIDGGIIAIDQLGKIIYINPQAFDLINSKHLNETNTKLQDILIFEELKNLIINNKNFKNKEIKFHNSTKSTYTLISGKSIIVKNKNCGAIITIKKLTDVYEEVNNLYNGTITTNFDEIIGNGTVITKLKSKAMTIAQSLSTVTIQGESGTGKEMIARAIHGASKISNGPFVAVNCAAIPDSLLESELFGYEEGAFSGAKKGGKIGKFQLANNGTIFLDEIGEMPLHLQTKLLRVIQERSIDRIGGTESIPINVRIIAATHKNLEEMIKSHEFREDLFYRIYVIPLKVPSLKERIEDIDSLVNYFLNRYNQILNKNIKGVTQDVMNIFNNYNWPGNVRELQNVVEYGANMTNSNYISIENIPSRIQIDSNIIATNTDSIQILPIEKIIQENIIKAINHFGCTVEGKTKAAKALGISRATLYRKLNEIENKL